MIKVGARKRSLIYFILGVLEIKSRTQCMAGECFNLSTVDQSQERSFK